MPVDRERQRVVREGIAEVRRLMAENPNIGRIDEEDPASRPRNLAEVLALLAAQARAVGDDETVWAEIALADIDLSKEMLLEARSPLSALGYDGIADVLKRMARSAKSRLTWRDRDRERNMEMRRRFRRSLAAGVRSGQNPN